MNALEDAQGARVDAELDALLESKLVGMAVPISAGSKVKLRDILKKYAKEDYPFKACVSGEMKRFGPGRVEAVCASLKSAIKTSPKFKSGGSAKMADDLTIDGEILLALDHISEIDLQEVFLEARAFDEHRTIEAVSLLEGVTGASELATWGSR